jgi:hypothetical protein
VLGKATAAGDHAIITRPNHLDCFPNSARSDAPIASVARARLWDEETLASKRCSCRLSVGRSTNLPIVWCCASGLGSRERGGRTRPQNGDSQHNLPTTFMLHVYASHSRFQPIKRDNGKCREMPNFALSRRQRVRIPLRTQGQTASV